MLLPIAFALAPRGERALRSRLAEAGFDEDGLNARLAEMLGEGAEPPPTADDAEASSLSTAAVAATTAAAVDDEAGAVPK